MGKIIIAIVNYVALFAQFIAIIVITIGMLKALFIYAFNIFAKRTSRDAIKESRLEIGYSFSLGLAFLIGASILKTTIAPTWTVIGQLSSIIAIRTVLNYFLMKDIKQIQNK